MKSLNLMLLALVLAVGLAASCKKDEEAVAGDADADIEVEDIRIEEIRPEEVGAEEIRPEEVAPEVDNDAVEVDIPTDDGTPQCVTGTLTCGSSLRDETTVGAPDNLNWYSCASDLDESGGEKVYSFTSPEARMVTIEMVTRRGDLDLFILSGECDPATCIAYSVMLREERVTFRAEANVTYYVAVDGYLGASDTYDITVTCTPVEICDNRIDDSGDLLIDCTDPSCDDVAVCTETVCNDERDNDRDGMPDCRDPECREEENCYESNCGDAIDNDGDTDIDCNDVECFGNAACAIGAGAIGDPCTSHSDCQSGGCWSELLNGWPGGYCIIFGEGDCTNNRCPAGSTCVEADFGYFGCFRDCGAFGQCRPGYLCHAREDICIPGCTEDAQCQVTGACDEYNAAAGTGGYCFPALENCANSIDDDGDNVVDCDDYDCIASSPCGTATPLPGGETCAEVVALPMPEGERGEVLISGTTTGKTADLTSNCMRPTSPDVVYSFQLTAPAFIMVDVVGGFSPPMSNDTGVSLRTSCDTGPDLLCNDDVGSTYYHSQISGSLAAGTFYIVVYAYHPERSPGDFNMRVKFSDLPQ